MKFVLTTFFVLLALWLYASKADAATFQMQTGYYVGEARSQTITGLGFQPELVIIKRADTTAAVWKSSAMTAANIAFFNNNADNTATVVTLDADGFTSSGSINAVGGSLGDVYVWIAFRGSDCTSSGTFCVGSYTGNGTAGNAITSVGFQPDIVWTKKSVSAGGGAQNSVWRSSAMSANESNFFVNVNSTTTAITSLNADGFTLGVSTTANENTRTYWYAAFKNVASFMDVGTYTGNGAIREINETIDSGLNFSPSWVFVKNSNNATAQSAVWNSAESHGNQSFFFDASVAVNTEITSSTNMGFAVETGTLANGNGDIIYYAAFGGARDRPLGSGTFKMQTGTYAGSGATTSITGVGFAPDLVIIKNQDQATDQFAVFSTSLDNDKSFEMARALLGYAGSITSLDSDGFTIGGNPAVNASGDTYYWIAFGNARRPDKAGGSADFYIGAYFGNNTDNRNINVRNSFTPALVAVKRADASASGAGRWKTSTSTPVDFGMSFDNVAPAVDNIQLLNAGGFQVGTEANTVNFNAAFYRWFAFAAGPYFQAGGYAGDGADNRNIFEKFKPDFMWIKRASTVATVQGTVFTTRTAAEGNLTLPFINTAAFTDGIQDLIFNGFQLGTNATVNESPIRYEYAAWKIQRTSVRIRGTIRLRSTHRLR